MKISHSMACKATACERREIASSKRDNSTLGELDTALLVKSDLNPLSCCSLGFSCKAGSAVLERGPCSPSIIGCKIGIGEQECLDSSRQGSSDSLHSLNKSFPDERSWYTDFPFLGSRHTRFSLCGMVCNCCPDVVRSSRLSWPYFAGDIGGLVIWQLVLGMRSKSCN